MKVTVLGCGPSGGVPTASGAWGACDPSNRKNHRRRPSIHVERDGVGILVDTSPDLRAQALDAGIKRLDAVLFTHTHADHIHGIDDLRPIRRATGHDLDAYGEAEVIAELRTRFGYLFEGGQTDPLYEPILRPHEIAGPFEVGGRVVVPFAQDHGICASTGYRFGPFAYSTDVVALGEDAFAALAGVEVWIVDCLRTGGSHPTHATLDVTLGWIERVRPSRAILTHMNHQTDFDEISRLLPPGVEPAYDGMVLDIPEGAR